MCTSMVQNMEKIALKPRLFRQGRIGRIHIVSLVPGLSTSNVIAKIKTTCHMVISKQEKDAFVFSSFCPGQHGIDNRCEVIQGGDFGIWVINEDAFEAAMQWYQLFSASQRSCLCCQNSVA